MIALITGLPSELFPPLVALNASIEFSKGYLNKNRSRTQMRYVKLYLPVGDEGFEVYLPLGHKSNS